MIIFEYISSGSILFAVIIGTLLFRVSDIQFKTLINLIWCAGIVELLSRYIQPGLVNGKYTINFVWYLFEFILIFLFYHFMMKSKVQAIKEMILWVVAYCVVVYQTGALDIYNPSVRLMMSTPLVLISTWGLYQSAKNKDLAVGIVSLGFLLYFLTTIPVFLYYSDLNRSIWVAHSIANILMNVLIGVGLYYGRSARVFKGNDTTLDRVSLFGRRSDLSRD